MPYCLATNAFFLDGIRSRVRGVIYKEKENWQRYSEACAKKKKPNKKRKHRLKAALKMKDVIHSGN